MISKITTLTNGGVVIRDFALSLVKEKRAYKKLLEANRDRDPKGALPLIFYNGLLRIVTMPSL